MSLLSELALANLIGGIHFTILVNWKDGELPVLPLSVYGAVAMAHSESSEEYSSPYQFFFYLYDKRNVSEYFIQVTVTCYPHEIGNC